MGTGIQAYRNIAFIGHPSSGKTTLVDAIAHVTGASARKGSVEAGTSLCDTEPEEHEKRHTLQLAAVHAEHGDRHWTFLDTPGYPDFMAETLGAMFASDLVCAVVSCTSGVTFNLRKKLEAAGRMGRPTAIVVTHLDGENADFEETVLGLREMIGETCVPVLLPDQSGPGFSALRRTYEVKDSEWRKRLMDRVMDACEDEELLMDYLDSQVLTEEQLELLMPHAIEKAALIPVLICNPETGLGVEGVYNYFKRFAPPPTEAEILDEEGEQVLPEEVGPLVASVFSVRSDPHVGKVCLARIWSGRLGAHDAVHLGDGEKPEKLGGLYHPVGKGRESVDSAGPGEIVAFSKVEHLGVGASFTTSEDVVRRVPGPEMPNPMVSLALFPRSRNDESKIGEALHKLVAEDPTLRMVNDPVTHELVVSGMSELHLQVLQSRLSRRYGVEVDAQLPRIPYRETITRAADGHHRHKKQSGGRGQFAECSIRLRPRERGEGNLFSDRVVGGAIPRNLIPAVEKGFLEAAAEGVLTSSTVVDVELELHDGKFHAVDSDEASFKMAGARAFREAFERAGPVLLEPLMAAEIHVPTEDAGAVFSDLTSHRRGHVTDQQTEAGGTITMIRADVPLSTMQSYHRDLKSLTSGEGSYSLGFAGYAQVPAAEQQRVLRDLSAARDAG